VEEEGEGGKLREKSSYLGILLTGDWGGEDYIGLHCDDFLTICETEGCNVRCLIKFRPVNYIVFLCFHNHVLYVVILFFSFMGENA